MNLFGKQNHGKMFHSNAPVLLIFLDLLNGLFPLKIYCNTISYSNNFSGIASQVNTVLTFTTDGCAGLQNEINYIEHVQLIADINHNNRGRLEIWLTSPAGTRTRLLKPRINDNSDGGFPSWPFMNLHNWGKKSIL